MFKPLDIVYQDDQIVVVDKPSGLLSVPGRLPEYQDCVVNRVRQCFPNCPSYPAVHRLDMATSGLLVLALSADSLRSLSIQFEKRKVQKSYVALLEGIVKENSGTIELPFRLDPDNRPHQIYDPLHGKIGITEWQKLGDESGCSRIKFVPLTGRTHQLRVHSAHVKGLGCPIIGDSLYGSGKFGDKMYLHAAYLSFEHPVSGKKLEFETMVPF